MRVRLQAEMFCIHCDMTSCFDLYADFARTRPVQPDSSGLLLAIKFLPEPLLCHGCKRPFVAESVRAVRPGKISQGGEA